MEAPEATPPGYGEDALEARPTLADFFSILLVGRSRCGEIPAKDGLFDP